VRLFQILVDPPRRIKSKAPITRRRERAIQDPRSRGCSQQARRGAAPKPGL